MEFIKNMEIKQLSYYINQAKIIKPENHQKKNTYCICWKFFIKWV